MRYRIPVIIDSIFVSVNAFLLLTTAMRFSAPKGVALFIAILGAAVAFFIFFGVASRRAEKRFLSKEDAKRCERVYRDLGTTPYKKAEEFLLRLVEKDLGRTLAPFRGNGKVFYRDEASGENYAFFPALFPVKKETLFEVWKENPSVRPIKAAVLCAEEGLDGFCRSFGMDLPQSDHWFRMMKRQDFFPSEQGATLPKRKPISGFFRRMLSKKRSKRFFAFGCWMLLLSFVIPFPVYYLFSGSVFLLLSLLSRFFGKAD